jgi:hypothetical protein
LAARFGGDPAAVGRIVTVNAVSYTVIGVAPRGFHGLGRTIEPDLVLPLTATDQAWTQASVLWLQVFGRRKPGVSLARARAEVETRWPTLLAATMPSTFTGVRRDNYLAIKPVVAEVTTRTDRFAQSQFAE